MSKMHEDTKIFLLKQLELLDYSIRDHERSMKYRKEVIDLQNEEIVDLMIKIDGLVETRDCLRKLLKCKDDE